MQILEKHDNKVWTEDEICNGFIAGITAICERLDLPDIDLVKKERVLSPHFPEVENKVRGIARLRADIGVKHKNGEITIFEVKKSAQISDIYRGIGQLTVYKTILEQYADLGKVNCVLVLSEVCHMLFDVICHNSLGIHVVEYSEDEVVCVKSKG